MVTVTPLKAEALLHFGVERQQGVPHDHPAN
jgi:hypothetical protein